MSKGRLAIDEFEKFVQQIYRLFRISALHNPNNDAVWATVKRATAAFRRMADFGIAKLDVLFVDDTVYVNGELLKAERDVYEFALDLSIFLEKIGFNDVTITAEVEENDLHWLVRTFAARTRDDVEDPGPSREGSTVSLREIDPSVVEMLREQKTSPEERLIQTYASSLVMMRFLYDGLMVGKRVPLRNMKRLIHKMVRAAIETPSLFKRLARMKSTHDDPAGRAIKTAAVAIGVLSLVDDDPKRLVMTALAALLHDTGRPRAAGFGRHSDPERLKVVPRLSAEEQARLPAATALVVSVVSRLHDDGLDRTAIAHDAAKLMVDPEYQTGLEAWVVHVARLFVTLLAFDVRTQTRRTPSEAASQILENGRTPTERHVARLLIAALEIPEPRNDAWEQMVTDPRMRAPDPGIWKRTSTDPLLSAVGAHKRDAPSPDARALEASRAITEGRRIGGEQSEPVSSPGSEQPTSTAQRFAMVQESSADHGSERFERETSSARRRASTEDLAGIENKAPVRAESSIARRAAEASALGSARDEAHPGGAERDVAGETRSVEPDSRGADEATSGPRAASRPVRRARRTTSSSSRTIVDSGEQDRLSSHPDPAGRRDSSGANPVRRNDTGGTRRTSSGSTPVQRRDTGGARRDSAPVARIRRSVTEDALPSLDAHAEKWESAQPVSPQSTSLETPEPSSERVSRVEPSAHGSNLESAVNANDLRREVPPVSDQDKRTRQRRDSTDDAVARSLDAFSRSLPLGARSTDAESGEGGAERVAGAGVRRRVSGKRRIAGNAGVQRGRRVTSGSAPVVSDGPQSTDVTEEERMRALLSAYVTGEQLDVPRRSVESRRSRGDERSARGGQSTGEQRIQAPQSRAQSEPTRRVRPATRPPEPAPATLPPERPAPPSADTHNRATVPMPELGTNPGRGRVPRRNPAERRSVSGTPHSSKATPHQGTGAPMAGAQAQATRMVTGDKAADLLEEYRQSGSQAAVETESRAQEPTPAARAPGFSQPAHASQPASTRAISAKESGDLLAQYGGSAPREPSSEPEVDLLAQFGITHDPVSAPNTPRASSGTPAPLPSLPPQRGVTPAPERSVAPRGGGIDASTRALDPSQANDLLAAYQQTQSGNPIAKAASQQAGIPQGDAPASTRALDPAQAQDLLAAYQNAANPAPRATGPSPQHGQQAGIPQGDAPASTRALDPDQAQDLLAVYQNANDSGWSDLPDLPELPPKSAPAPSPPVTAATATKAEATRMVSGGEAEQMLSQYRDAFASRNAPEPEPRADAPKGQQSAASLLAEYRNRAAEARRDRVVPQKDESTVHMGGDKAQELLLDFETREPTSAGNAGNAGDDKKPEPDPFDFGDDWF